MKRNIAFIFSVIMLLCACSPQGIGNITNGEQVEIAFVISLTGVEDGTYNQCIWETINSFAKNNGVQEKNVYYVQISSENLVEGMANVADKKPDLIVVSGYYFSKALEVISKKYPEQKFILIDGVVDSPNVISITHLSNEGSFLVGIAAALKAKQDNRDMVGFLGGTENELIYSFEAGFNQGVKMIDSEIKILRRYADDFANPIEGQRLAKELYDEGAYIVFHAAGDTGNGLIAEAKERVLKGDNVWAIGVDKDQYQSGIYADGESVILTSMLNNFDRSVYEILKSFQYGNFKAEHFEYGLKTNSVGLPKDNPNLTAEQLAIIEEYKEKIINGEIAVSNSLE